MSPEIDPLKVRNLRPLCPLFSFSLWHVKGPSSKRVALKADVLQNRNMFSLLPRPCSFQPGNVTGSGSEGVKTTLSPIEWFLHEDGQRCEPFNVSLIVRDRVTIKTLSTDHNFWRQRRAKSGIEPRSFCLPAYNALPLGQTGSQH